jgi:hypothetical protein
MTNQPRIPDEVKAEVLRKSGFRRVVNTFQAVSRRLANIWRRIIKNCFGFYGRLRLKLVIVAIFIGAAILLTHAAVTNCGMPFSAPSAIAIAILFMLFLLTDTLRFLFDLLYSSPNESLLLVREIDTEIKKALNDVEELVKSLKGEAQKDEIRFQARDICSNFLSRPPYPRITFRFACHAILNFLLIIFCFMVLTIGLVRMDVYYGTSLLTYGHECFKDSTFYETLVHFYYYHVVIFQSLGDGHHSPTTIFAQAIAIGETFTSFFYIFLTFGGIYNAGATARDNLTPRLIRTSIEKYLVALCSNDNPVINSEDL